MYSHVHGVIGAVTYTATYGATGSHIAAGFVAFVFLLIARSFIIAFRCRDASLHPAPSIIISFLPILSWIILIRLAIKPSEPIEPRN